MKDGYYWLLTPLENLQVVQVQSKRMFGIGNKDYLYLYQGQWFDMKGAPVEVRQLIGPIEPPFLTGHERQRDAR